MVGTGKMSPSNGSERGTEQASILPVKKGSGTSLPHPARPVTDTVYQPIRRTADQLDRGTPSPGRNLFFSPRTSGDAERRLRLTWREATCPVLSRKEASGNGISSDPTLVRRNLSTLACHADAELLR